ncbi:MAG: right-handed parallel beta-helix repeat-containing protein, partial [Bacteroidales bacterium]|nr:right-handed parallel beta-helix repeat-containing protein [Bacteroidales bacterium]
MKKLMRLAAFAAAAATLFVACNKEQPAPERPAEDGRAVIRVSIPESLTKVSLTDETAAGRGMKLAWQDEDAIRVRSGENSSLFTIRAGFSGHEAEFEGTPVEGTEFDIIYPGTYETVDALAERDLLDQTQIGNGSTAHLCYNALLQGVDTYEDIAFTDEWADYHGGSLLQNGVLKLVVTLPDDASVVTRAALCGPGDCFFADNLAGSLTDEIFVTLQDVDVSQSSQVLTAYMNIAAFDVTLSAGETYRVKVTGADNKEYVKDFTLDAEAYLNAGKLNTIRLTAAGEVEILSEYFVTPTGAGNKSGADWDNALGIEEFRAVLATPASKAAEFDGVVFLLAEGDYYLAGEAGGAATLDFTGYLDEVAVDFVGGFPAGLTGTTVTGRDTTQFITAFTGNDDAAIIRIGNQVNAAFEGITFKKSLVNANSAALYAKAAEGTSSLYLTSCRFVNNNNSDAKSGAAVYISNNIDASIDNCYFGKNYARNGSAVNIDAESNVLITESLFYKNSSYNTSGALQNGGSTALVVESCNFVQNTAGSWGGGAFHCNGSSDTEFTNCVFSGNSAPQAGAVSIETASATFNDCSFGENVATNGDRSRAGNGELTNEETKKGTALDDNVAGGAILLRNANSACVLSDCEFIENSAPNGCGGAIASLNKDATLSINGLTQFSCNTAYFHGGAIFAKGFSVNGTSTDNVVFDGNKTLATGNQHANGGTIWLAAGTTTSISYASFIGGEAGQKDGSTVNYSNGGAISMKGVTSFLADHCEFTGCIGRNGGCLNLELGASSVCKFSDCDFHDNNCTSGSSGNFHGAAARVSYGTAIFERCSFTNNVANNGSGVFHLNNNKAARIECEDCTFTGNSAPNGNGGVATVEYGSFKGVRCTFSNNRVNVNGGSGTRYGGVFRCDDKDVNTLDLEGCTFTGNYANQGAVLNVNAKNLTRINNCVFEDNKADSRGMIQMNKGVVFINGTSFHNNKTTANNGWGVSLHGGAAALCLNNVTVYGNTNSSTTVGNNNAAINGPASLLITNSTVIESNQLALVRSDGTGPLVMCNNMLVNTVSGKDLFVVNNSSGTIVSLGHNAMGTTTNEKYSDPGTDLAGLTEASFGGAYEASASGVKKDVYVWNGSLTGFTPAVQADVEAAMTSNFAISVSDLSMSNVGQAFHDWLAGLTPAGYAA